MKKNYLIGILLLFSFVAIKCRTNKPLVDYDVYCPDKTLTNYKYLDKGDSIELFVSLDNLSLFSKISKEEFRQINQMSYSVFVDVTKKNPILSDSLTTNNCTITKSNNTFILTFSVPKIKNLASASVLLFRNDQRRNFVETDFIYLDYEIEKKNRNLILKNESANCLIFKNFIPLNDTLKIISGDQKPSNITINLIKKRGLPASPPHRAEKDSTQHFKKEDSIFTLFTSNTFLPNNTGLYILKKDPQKADGYPILVTASKYPHITTVDEMIDPLVYITNRNDFKKIKTSANPKASLDSFWLRIGNNKDYTRSLIKAYYERVEYANLAFTSHKEGWKTDRGMIYIVFGKPDEVYKNEDSEDWVYENVLAKLLTFTFTKSKDFSFLEDFELNRAQQYQEAWYTTIEKWRNGTIRK